MLFTKSIIANQSNILMNYLLIFKLISLADARVDGKLLVSGGYDMDGLRAESEAI